ncbi:SGNH/GDSL hydrolase family protein [Gymnodinialimonas hymeniacidonis]|uniref:SGNH/GDSL hydrolase family protein n=1 Tax=Gymnodinialimonas hymeniacidonis TaxID=3126508 RepID=UPI0034C5D33D
MALLRAAFLSPVIVPQLVWVRLRASRLPEAAGPREGQTGAGRALRVLVIGDSTAAGVGVETQAEALAGQLSSDLARDHSVTWKLVARSGAIVPDLLEMLAGVEGSFDCALICQGVNDAKNGRLQPNFEREYASLLRTLSDRFGVRTIVCSGLPPMQFFTLLPRPLRDVLGARAARFDRAIAGLADAHPGAQFLPMNFTDDVSLMASDGFHPGPRIYAMWAERAAEMMRAG